MDRLQTHFQNQLNEITSQLNKRIDQLTAEVDFLKDRNKKGQNGGPYDSMVDNSKQYSTPRSCQEARSADPSLQSGNYYIDPDGTNIGDSPISVYCDMTTGINSFDVSDSLMK